MSINRCLILVLMVTLLAACDSGGGESTPIPTAVPPELSMVIVPAQPVDDATIAQFEETLLEETDLVIDVVTVARTADALKALCTEDDLPTIAWLDGLTFAIAQAQRCGDPYLHIARSEATVLNAQPSADATAEATSEVTPESDATPEATAETEDATESDEASGALITGMAGQIVARSNLESTALNAAIGSPYCRISVTDFYSWLLPVLAFDAASIDIGVGASEIIDNNSVEAMLENLSDENCAFAGVQAGTPLPEGVTVSQTTPEVPFGVLVYGLDVQLGVRLSLNEKLVEMAEDEDIAEVMRPFLMQDAIMPVEENTFGSWLSFLNSTGLDLSQLGR